MTEKQIKWASRHDWFEGYVNGKLIVREESVSKDGIATATIIEFTGSFPELRDWAGY